MSVIFFVILRKTKSHVYIKPWRNGVADQRKFGNKDLPRQTCHGWPNGPVSRRKCRLGPALVSRKTILRQTCPNLRWEVKRFTCLTFELDESKRKISQLHASHGQTESQVVASYQWAITCDSILPEPQRNLNNNGLMLFRDTILVQ